MRSLAFRTYLIGQSSKLAQEWELKAYAKGHKDRQPLDGEFWVLIQHAPHLSETERFADSTYAEAVFDRMPEPYLARLTELFSQHHRNCVHRKISKEENWELETFPITQVEVGYVEEDLDGCIRRHHHDLSAVASDPAVVAHPHYNRDLRTGVPYDVFLADFPTPDLPRLIDGNHRAIHQARQLAGGHSLIRELKIVVPSERHRKIDEERQ